MIYFLFLTALAVSIDSFICGFSLAKTSNKKFCIVFCIFLTVLAMCIFANYFAKSIRIINSNTPSIIGAFILIAIGVFNCFNIKKSNEKQNNYFAFFLVGFAVGIDGAMANLSVSLMGLNEFYVPIIIAVMHAIMVFLGIVISNVKIPVKIKWLKYFAPFILIVLGTYKLISVI